jgi:hypothetical protein
MKIQQNQKKSVKITCFLTRNSVYFKDLKDGTDTISE